MLFSKGTGYSLFVTFFCDNGTTYDWQQPFAPTAILNSLHLYNLGSHCWILETSCFVSCHSQKIIVAIAFRWFCCIPTGAILVAAFATVCRATKISITAVYAQTYRDVRSPCYIYNKLHPHLTCCHSCLVWLKYQLETLAFTSCCSHQPLVIQSPIEVIRFVADLLHTKWLSYVCRERVFWWCFSRMQHSNTPSPEPLKLSLRKLSILRRQHYSYCPCRWIFREFVFRTSCNVLRLAMIGFVLQSFISLNEALTFFFI